MLDKKFILSHIDAVRANIQARGVNVDIERFLECEKQLKAAMLRQEEINRESNSIAEQMSRKGIERASITVHPSGIPHGPHPGTYEGSIGKKETHELAVMVDTFRPLRISAAAQDLEDEQYPTSWVANP